MIFLGDVRDPVLRSRVSGYHVMIADPPWVYENQAPGASTEVYPTLSDREIVDLRLGEFTAPDSVLLLWTTWAKIEVALLALQMWDFTYVTGFPWVKLSTAGNGPAYGLGFWVRGCSEPVLIAKRGNARPPLREQWLGLLSPNLDHSRKPDDLYSYAESLPIKGPYLEVFARRSRSGWDSVGIEVDSQTAPPPPSLESFEEFSLGEVFRSLRSASRYYIKRISPDGQILLGDTLSSYIRWTTPHRLRNYYVRDSNQPLIRDSGVSNL